MTNSMPIRFVGKFDNQISQGAMRANKDLQNMGKSAQSANTGFKSILATAGVVVGVLGALGIAAKKTFEFAKQGAELEYTATKFDRLAQSINTTADSLISRLQVATKGTRSEMELMASAGDFMALGLAKNEDELVRLTRVAGGLNMNMNQLVLTLTNMTTMRFDALGVSVDGFKEKVKKLEATGLSAAEAFQEAFLQQAEDQLQRVGDVADETIGSFMKLEAELANTADLSKRSVAQALGPLANALSEAAHKDNLFVEALIEGNYIIKQAGNVVTLYTGEIITNTEAKRRLYNLERLMTDETQNLADETYYATRAYEEYEDVVWEAEAATAATADEMFKLADQTAKATNKLMSLSEQLRSLPSETGLTNLIADIERLEAGAGILVGIEDMITENIDALGLEFSTQLAKEAEAGRIAIEHALGNIDTAEAQAKLEALGMAPEAAKAILEDVQAQLDKINDMVAVATVIINVSGGISALAAANAISPGRQAGGDFVVPPTATNDSMRVGVTAGERVSVTTASQTKADELDAYFAGQLQADRNAEALARVLMPILVGV